MISYLSVMHLLLFTYLLVSIYILLELRLQNDSQSVR